MTMALTPPGTVSPIAHTAEEAAAIIGGTCKASWLKAQARQGIFPCLKIAGAYNFTDVDIAEILAILHRPAKVAPAASAASAAVNNRRSQAPPAQPPAATVTILRARSPRQRKSA
jgi:hypothetical protein